MTTRQQKLTPYQRALFEALWYAGISEIRMGAEFDLRPDSVTVRARAEGLDKRASGKAAYKANRGHDPRSDTEIINAVKAELRKTFNPWRQAMEKREVGRDL